MRYIYGVDLEKEAKRKKKRELEQQAKEREYDALMEMHKRDMAMYERSNQWWYDTAFTTTATTGTDSVMNYGAYSA